MDDNQCRVCLGATDDSRYSVFKKVNGVAIEEKLYSVCSLKITEDDSFSKMLCKKCFNETCSAYALKSKCLDTDRTLKILEKKLNEKLSKLSQSIEISNMIKHEEYEEPLTPSKEDLGDENVEMIVEEEIFAADEEIAFEESGFQVYEVETTEPFPMPNEIYEEIEYLDEVQEVKPVTKNKKSAKIFCIYCQPNRQFKTEMSLNRHKFEEHQIGVDMLLCHVCGFEFDGNLKDEHLSRLIQKHKRAHERGKNVRNSEINANRCKGCFTVFESAENLKTHLWLTNCRKNAQKPFKCYICNETFFVGVMKKKHVQTEHQDKAGADCPRCLRCKIPSAVAFENHYKTHFAEPRFYCNYCARPFYESDRLQMHIRRAHELTKYECFWCRKSFRDKSGITRHILGVHFNRRNHRCQICQKAFTESYNLKEHLFSVHKQASKFYSCDLCNSDFLYRKQFERHREKCSGYPERRKR